MGKYDQYKIALRSLASGAHEFKYSLDNKFFELLDDGEADIKKGKLDVTVIVKTTATTFDFTFDINGTVLAPCDRCLDDITMEVSTANKLIVKFGTEYAEESDEIVIIPEEDGEINIAWFLYEFILLSLPIKRVHPAGQCNKLVSSKLNRHKVTSTNEEDSDDVSEEEDNITDDDISSTDSRWDGLKDIVIDED